MKQDYKNKRKKCIVLLVEEYEDIIKAIFGNDIEVEFSYDGIDYYSSSDDEDNIPYNEEINQELAKYFEVDVVTSVHTDDCDTPLVWVVYKEEGEN